MEQTLLIVGIVLLLCITSSKLLYKVGVPTLLIFLVLGMLFGSDGIVGIHFSDYGLAERICSLGLLFIMFYGGFGVNWKIARPVAAPAIVMSTLGVLITAALTGLFCYLLLGFTLLEGMLVGAVVASTDAASVFSILRSRKLNLKGGLASLLEIESGSNDPIAYMLTLVVLTMMQVDAQQSIAQMLVLQIGVGLLAGFVLSKGAAFILNRVRFEIDGLYPILVMALAIVAYSSAALLGGNGYLCVYIVGIVLGNSPIPHKKNLVHFFDGLSWLMQILLFFTLGLLCFPSMLPSVMVAGILLSLFMIFIARPAATFGLLSFFKMPFKHKIFVSWVGLRGAASIAFAIFAVTYDVSLNHDIFHMVFFVALFSVAVQGTLIPLFARKLDLVEDSSPVLKTFNDYQEEVGNKLLELEVMDGNPLIGQSLMDAQLPEDILVVMIKRGEEIIVPRGSTTIQLGDSLVLSGDTLSALPQELKVFNDYQQEVGHRLLEMPVNDSNRWVDRTLLEADIPPHILVIMIRRGDCAIVPKGSTRIRSGDVLVLSGDNFDDILPML